MKESYDILFLGDHPPKFQQLRLLLPTVISTPLEIHTFSVSGATYRKQTSPPDLIFFDLTVYDDEQNIFVHEAIACFPQVPLIVLTRANDFEAGLYALRSGAQDYLELDDLNESSLKKAVLGAATRKSILREYQNLFEHSPVPMYIFSIPSLEILAANNAAFLQYGYSREAFMNLKIPVIYDTEEWPKFSMELDKHDSDQFHSGLRLQVDANGESFYAKTYGKRIQFRGRAAFIQMASNVNEQVLAEREVQKKARELEDVLQQMTDAFFTLDRNGRFTYVNQEYLRVTGFQRNEIIGKEFLQVFQLPESSVFYQKYLELMRGRKSVHFEGFFEPLGFWSSVNGYPVEHGVAVYFIDISEQKRTQQALEIAEQNLRAIINNTQDIIFSIDRNLEIISANNAFWMYVRELTGGKTDNYSPEDFRSDLMEQWSSIFSQVFEGHPAKFVWKDEVRNATRFSEVSLNPIFDSNRQIKGVSCFSRNITEELRLQQDVFEKQRNISAIIENTPDMIWSLDRDFKLLFANESFLSTVEKYTGSRPDIGERIDKALYKLGSVDEFWEYYQKAFNGACFTIERVVHPGGNTEPVYSEVRFNPIFDADHQIKGVSCFARDITELRRQLSLIEAQNERLREIAWQHSHRIRNHVATIMGLVQHLDTVNPANPDNNLVVQGISDSAHLLDQSIREISRISREVE